MSKAEQAFPSRLLRTKGFEAAGLEAAIDAAKINQHIEGRLDGRRVMTDDEVTQLLNDAFARLVLRQGQFPRTLGELLRVLDQHNTDDEGVPQQESYLVSEGGQISFSPGVDKGGSRLIVVRFRANSPELLISTLLPPGRSPRSDELLTEVLSWDPTNRTFHFYQRQEGTWFWCGQSDMALDDETRGRGPFDSHVNGYPIMKELKSPWVHWHGPGLGIAETAYSPDDPLVSDPLFVEKDNALNFESRVVRPLAERWNVARFEKAVQDGELTNLRRFMAQILEATSANLISTHVESSQLATRDLDDLSPTFFFDLDSIVGETGVPVQTPPLRMSGTRYRMLIDRYDLRVRGGSVDSSGDVPFCFTVPERALEDVLVVKILIQRGVMSPRLGACLLMVDFPNPVGSPRRVGLMKHVPQSCGLDKAANLDAMFVPTVLAAAEDSPPESPEREFAANWNVGPEDWHEVLADRVDAYLAKLVARLATDDGCDEVFRLAESRRRQFSTRSLAEFQLLLPQAVAIPADAPELEMTEEAVVRPRT